jgi:hypothetical protein
VDQLWAALKDVAERLGESATIRALTTLFTSLRKRLQRTSQRQQDDLITTWSAELDRLVSDLSPAFDLGKDTSLPVLIFNLNHGQDDAWRGVDRNLAILQS